MKASVCLLLGVAVFSTLLLESSTASTGDGGLLGSVVGGVGDLVGNLLEAVKQLLSTVTPTLDKVTGLVTGLWNEAGTLVQNTTGTAKDVVTEVQTISASILDTVPKIVAAIARGTTESLNETSGLIATLGGRVEQLVDIFAANPQVADLFKTAGAVVNIVPKLIESLNNSVDQVKVQVSV